MSGRRQDDLERLLDADRGEFGAIYDRLARAEPPRRLDRAILAEASRVALGPRAPRAQRWLLGLGSAAGLVLAAGIAWQVGRNTGQDPALDSRAAPQPAARSVVPVQPIAAPSAPAEPEPPPAIAPPERAQVSDREAETKSLESRRQRQPPRAEAARTAAPPPPAAPPAPAPAPWPLEEARPEAAAGPNVERLKAAPTFEAPRADRADAAAGAAGAAAASGMREPAAARESRPGTPSASQQLRSNMRLAPADWIAEIRRLVETGRQQQAVENLRLFRRLHPDWPLDADLRRLDE